MGYLDNTTITVDAILTKKGRELLAAGFNISNQITKFAVADDEIDYGLYDLAHPLGTAYYGSSIENMPVLEAAADETQNLRYKLVTLPRGTGTAQAFIPKLSGDFSAVELTYNRQTSNQGRQIDVETVGGFDRTEGYTAILYDAEAADIIAVDEIRNTATGTTSRFIENNLTSTSKVVTALSAFRVVPKQVSQTTVTQLAIVGNQTGATTTIRVTINPEIV